MAEDDLPSPLARVPVPSPDDDPEIHHRKPWHGSSHPAAQFTRSPALLRQDCIPRRQICLLGQDLNYRSPAKRSIMRSKVFVPGKPPVDYIGAREVNPIAEFALKQHQDYLFLPIQGYWAQLFLLPSNVIAEVESICRAYSAGS
ncbi:disulfide isomerase-like 2-3-like protein [Drosera capensis]